jgi:MFS family permease
MYQKYNQLFQKNPTLIALGLAMAPCLAISLTRFSYSLFIPAMRDDLGWGYFLSGLVGSANGFGYFIGVFLALIFIHRYSVSFLLILSGIATSIFVGLGAAFDNTILIIGFRIFAGMMTAIVMISSELLVAELADKYSKKSGWFFGIYYAGVGFGIIVTAFLVPYLINLGQALDWVHAWKLAWLAIALLIFISSLILWRPCLAITINVVPKRKLFKVHSVSDYLPMIGAFFCYGLGYLGYFTFIVAFLREIGMEEFDLSLFFATIGLCIMASAKLWAKILTRLKGGKALALFNVILFFSCLIPFIVSYGIHYLSEPFVIVGIYFSAILFGSCCMSAKAATTAFIRFSFPEPLWAKQITFFLIFFALGQVVGPVLVGWVSESHSLATGFLASAFVLLVGSILAYKQKKLN